MEKIKSIIEEKKHILMDPLSITIKSEKGEIKAKSSHRSLVYLVFEESYVQGDYIEFGLHKVPDFYVIRVDDTMDEALVYICHEVIKYQIPFSQKKDSYNPKAFTGDRHYMTLRQAEDYEVMSYRNLAKNVMDQHDENGVFPHASANVETRGEAVFEARNALDGIVSNHYHGIWPFESWGINAREDAAWTISFGREVDICEIRLFTRSDFPHDNWWTEARLTFSNGSECLLEMEKSSDGHCFELKEDKVEWIRLSHLLKSNDPSPFPALTECQVYGKESVKG